MWDREATERPTGKIQGKIQGKTGKTKMRQKAPKKEAPEKMLPVHVEFEKNKKTQKSTQEGRAGKKPFKNHREFYDVKMWDGAVFCDDTATFRKPRRKSGHCCDQ